MLDDNNEVPRQPHEYIVQVILFVWNKIVLKVFIYLILFH